MEEKFINKTTASKIQAIAVLMMIVHHTFGFPDKILEGISFVGIQIEGGEAEVFIGQMCKICVSLFAFMSGYAFAIKKDWTWKYVIKKSLNLLILYWITLIIFIVLGLTGGKNVTLNSLLSNIVTISSSVNYSSWYVSFYLLALVTMKIFFSKFQKGFKSCLCFILTFWILSIVVEKSGIHIWNGFISYIQYMPVILIGCMAGKSKYFNTLGAKLSANIRGVLCAMMMLLVTLGLRVFTGAEVLSFHLIWIYVTPICLALATILIYFSKLIWINKLLDLIGDYSTEIWLLNAIFTSGVLWIQKICFAPRVSILIFIWETILLLIMSVPVKFVWKKSIGYLRIQ